MDNNPNPLWNDFIRNQAQALRRASRVYRFTGWFDNGDSPIFNFKRIISQWVGQTILIIVGIDGVETQRVEVTIPQLTGAQFRSWYDAEKLYLMIIYPNNIMDGANNFDKTTSKEGTIRIIPVQGAANEAVDQQFLDGINHCVLSPMMDWVDEKILGKETTSPGLVGTSNKSSCQRNVRRYLSIKKFLGEALIKYKDGIPQKDLQNLCNELGFNVKIFVPDRYGYNELWLSFKGEKGRISWSKSFNFMNTRWNHLDTIIKLNRSNTLESDEFDAKEEELKSQNIMYGYDNGNLKNKLMTGNEVFLRDTEYNKIVNEWETENQLSRVRMNAKTDPELLTNFIKASCVYNGTVDFMDTSKFRFNPELPKGSSANKFKNIQNRIKREGIKHIDMEKAYTNCDKTEYFKGYLGKVWEFRKTKKLMGLGFYIIRNIKNIPPIIKELGILYEWNIYFSPELEYYKDLGIKFEIMAGAWGSQQNIEWTDGMLEKSPIYQNNGKKILLRNYCKWFGCGIRYNEYSVTNFDTDDEKYIDNVSRAYKRSEVNITYHENVEKDKSDSQYTLRVETPKVNIYHYTNICSSILGYQRILMIQQLLKIKHENIIRVCVDGIYYKGDDIEIIEPFRSKDDRNFSNTATDAYRTQDNQSGYLSPCHDTKEDYDWDDWDFGKSPDPYEPEKSSGRYKNEVHTGAGGCGKTYKNLMDNGLINPLYIGHSWKLCRSKNLEFNVKAVPNQQITFDLITKDKKSYVDNTNDYNVLIVDEVSTLTFVTQEKIEKLYPHHKIIWCGDINKKGVSYQCPPFGISFIHGGGFKIKEDYKVIKHKINRRVKQSESGLELLKILGMLRNCVDKFALKISQEWIEKNIIKDKFKYLKDDDDFDYNKEDYILCRTHNRCFIFDEKYADIEKYKIINEGYGNIKADIVYTKPSDGKFIDLDFLKTKKKISNKGAYSIKHGYTIDCIQGETASEKLFIDIKNLDSVQHLYTAMSRAKENHQIIFIGRN